MKVKDLISALSKYDDDFDVLCYIGEKVNQASPFEYSFLEIDHISTTDGELMRTDDGIPGMKFGKTPDSKTIVTLDVIADF